MKTRKHLYLIYLRKRKLDNSEDAAYIKDVVLDFSPNEEGMEYPLYGFSDDKKLVAKFFDIHNPDYFYVKKIKGNEDSIKEYPRYRLLNVRIGCGVVVDGKVKYSTPTFCLTQFEYDDIGYSLETTDDAVYDCWEYLRKYPFSNKIFTKKIQKALKDIKAPKILEYLSYLYDDDGYHTMESPTDWFRVNEWVIFRSIFGPVLIGGYDYESPYL